MTVDSRVKFSSPFTGGYVGIIVGEGRDMLGDYWAVKVTSRKSLHYPFGTIDHISKGTPWLRERI